MKTSASTYVSVDVAGGDIAAAQVAVRDAAIGRLGGDGSDLELVDIATFGEVGVKKLGATYRRQWEVPDADPPPADA